MKDRDSNDPKDQKSGKMKNSPPGGLSKLGEVVFNYTMDCIDEVVPLDLKTEEERVETEEVVSFSIQMGLVVLDRLLEGGKVLDQMKLEKVYKLIKEQRFEEADELLFGKIEDHEEGEDEEDEED